MRGFWILSLAVACGDDAPVVSVSDFQAQAESFMANSDISGSFGYELVGHGSVFYSTDFVDTCLRENQLGWMESVGVMFRGDRTSYFMTNYEAQQYMTQTTEDGYCLYLGENLSVELIDVVEDSEGRELEANPFTIRWALTSSDPSPYFECLSEQVLNPTVTVLPNQSFEAPAALSLFDNACQGMPEPYSREDEGGDAYPSTEPPSAPTTAEIQTLLEDFDDALASRDLEAALEHVQCYNLLVVDRTEVEEDEPERQPDEAAIGACIPSDLLDTGPSFASTEDSWLIPWLEGHIDSVSEVLEPTIERGAEPANVYHIELANTDPDPDLAMPRRRGNKSITVQWVNGEWKLLGLIESANSGITPVRFVNDLHGDIFIPMRPEGFANAWNWQVRHWYVFWDRLLGYPIDSDGCPIDDDECTEEAMEAFNSLPGRRIRPLR